MPRRIYEFSSASISYVQSSQARGMKKPRAIARLLRYAYAGGCPREMSGCPKDWKLTEESCKCRRASAQRSRRHMRSAGRRM